MINYIPEFYFDELLYSFLARLKTQTLLNLDALSKILFGRKDGNYNVLFPRSVDKVAQHLKIFGYDANSIIRDHSMAPLYELFYSDVKYHQLINHLKGGAGSGILPPETNPYLSLSSFKYCLLCCEEDKAEIGETYLRRSHNIPQIEICTKHSTILNSFDFHLRGNSHYKIFDLNDVFKSNSVVSFNRSELVLNLATDLHHKLNNRLIPNISELQLTAKRKGFFKQANNSLYFDKKLYSGLLEYSESNSKFLFKMVAENHQRLIGLMNGTWSGNMPILYFLIKRYLEILPDKDLDRKNTLELKCINKYCENFNSKPISSVFKYFDSKKNYGFIGECPQCGLEYEFSPSRTERKIFIRKLGPVMEGKINELKGQHGYKKISKILEIPKSRVLNHLNSHFTNTTKDLERKRKVYRKKWRHAIESSKSIGASTKVYRGIYVWLLKNDRKWIDNLNDKYRITNRSLYKKRRYRKIEHIKNHAL